MHEIQLLWTQSYSPHHLSIVHEGPILKEAVDGLFDVVGILLLSILSFRAVGEEMV